jgi:hypothetical protein
MDTNSVGEYANGLEVDTVENTLQTTNFGKYLSYFKLHSKYRYFYGIQAQHAECPKRLEPYETVE